MKDALKVLTDETRAKLIASIASKSVIDLIAVTKDASEKDAGTFRVVISTSDVDRQGDSVTQSGWDLNFFKSNPVVLWAHDYEALPIGMCTKIEVDGNRLIAEGKFAPAEANPFAQQIRRLYDLGMVNTTSVGFIPKEYDANRQGVIMKQELLEFSFVPVPANPYALRLDQMKSFDLPYLLSKGIKLVEKTEEEKKSIEVSKAIEILKNNTTLEHERHSKEMMSHIEKCMKSMTDEEGGETGEEKAKNKAISINKAIEILKSDTTLEQERHSKEMGTHLENFGHMMSDNDADDQKTIEEKKTVDEKNVQASLIEETVKSTITSLIALGDIVLAKGDKNDKGDTVVTTRSKSSKGLTELNDFLEARSLLRQIDNSLEVVLRGFNKAAKDHEKKK